MILVYSGLAVFHGLIQKYATFKGEPPPIIMPPSQFPISFPVVASKILEENEKKDFIRDVFFVLSNIQLDKEYLERFIKLFEDTEGRISEDLLKFLSSNRFNFYISSENSSIDDVIDTRDISAITRYANVYYVERKDLEEALTYPERFETIKAERFQFLNESFAKVENNSQIDVEGKEEKMEIQDIENIETVATSENNEIEDGVDEIDVDLDKLTGELTEELLEDSDEIVGLSSDLVNREESDEDDDQENSNVEIGDLEDDILPVKEDREVVDIEKEKEDMELAHSINDMASLGVNSSVEDDKSEDYMEEQSLDEEYKDKGDEVNKKDKSYLEGSGIRLSAYVDINDELIDKIVEAVAVRVSGTGSSNVESVKSEIINEVRGMISEEIHKLREKISEEVKIEVKVAIRKALSRVVEEEL